MSAERITIRHMGKTAAKPGWYPAPDMPNARRYWDGHQWTQHLTPAQPTSTARKVAVGTLTVIGVLLGIALVVYILLALAALLLTA